MNTVNKDFAEFGQNEIGGLETNHSGCGPVFGSTGRTSFQNKLDSVRQSALPAIGNVRRKKNAEAIAPRRR
jgi:hypothetical protein